MKEKNKSNKKGDKKNNSKKKNVKKNVPRTEVKENFKKKEDVKGETPLVTNNEIINLVKIIIVIVAILLIFYGVTVLIAENKNNDNNQNGEVTIQYDEILLGTLFEQHNSEYYVLVTKEDDYYTDTYKGLLSMYSASESAIRFYTANLDNAFNKSYEDNESNISNNLAELKFNGATLLRVKDKHIVASYKGNIEIVEHLNQLLK